MAPHNTKLQQSAMNEAAENRKGKKHLPLEVANRKLKRVIYIIWIAVGAAVLTGIVVYLLNILALPISMLIWTLIIVFVLRSLVASLEKRGLNRLAGTTIAYIIMFAVLGLILFLMFSPMFGLNKQFADLISNIPNYIKAIVDWGQGIAEKYSSLLDNESIKGLLSSAAGSVSQWASGLAGSAANAAIDIGTGIANTIYAVGFAFVIAFWVLLELPAMGREMKRVIPPKRLDEAHFFHVTFTRILGGYLKGTLIQCFIIGVACGILFAVIGIQNAPALGVITGVLNIIPIIGPWLGGAAAAITAVFISPLTALLALIGVIVIQQIVYTFISPKIMSNSVDIHPALTLIAMTFGSAIGGAMSGLMGSLVGLLFAIPFVAVMKSIFIFYFERATGRQIVSSEGFIFKGKPTADGTVDPLYDATSGNIPPDSMSKFEGKIKSAFDKTVAKVEDAEEKRVAEENDEEKIVATEDAAEKEKAVTAGDAAEKEKANAEGPAEQAKTEDPATNPPNSTNATQD